MVIIETKNVTIHGSEQLPKNNKEGKEKVMSSNLSVNTYKKYINITARYIVGIWGLALVFLLACILNKKNSVADALLGSVFVVFCIITVALFATYLIHLVWMIQERWKPQNIKSDIISEVLLILCLSAYNFYKGQFGIVDFLKILVYVILIYVFAEIGKYIYSWKA